jgi:hypothetical protein
MKQDSKLIAELATGQELSCLERKLPFDNVETLIIFLVFCTSIVWISKHTTYKIFSYHFFGNYDWVTLKHKR